LNTQKKLRLDSDYDGNSIDDKNDKNVDNDAAALTIDDKGWML
jgi:hypothetical protein